MRMAGLHPLDTGDAILLRLVGEHRPRDAVADRPHAGGRRAEQAVNRNIPALVGLDADGVEADVGGGRAPPRGGEHAIAVDRLEPLTLHHRAA